MRRCLSPFFIGREELGLDNITGEFDFIIESESDDLVPGSRQKISSINNSIKSFVSHTLEINETPIVLSGDCLSAMGCLAGVQQCHIEASLIWFDAHGDFHTNETTISGHLGGMPLAMITGRGDQLLLSDLQTTPIPDERVCFVGGRDLDPGEKESLMESAIVMCTRITEVIDRLSKTEKYWIHFDTDYINPIDAPAMRYSSKGGILASVLKNDLEILRNSIQIVGLSISAWAPHLDLNNGTAKVCWDALSGLMN